MQYAALSESGRVRENNEDACHADGRLFIVADGMGGHRAGEVASAAAIDEFLRFESGNRDVSPLERMVGGIRAANTALFRMVEEDPGLQGMGTTFTAVLVEGCLYLGHVGDSRAYMWRKGELRLLSRDHSLVERLVSEGHLSPREARVHPRRNVILRALGMAEELEADTDVIDAAPGDRLLLCSDGLSGSIEDVELQAIVCMDVGAEERCRRLVDAANERGGTDNITAIVVDLEDEIETVECVVAEGRRPWWRGLVRAFRG